VSAFGNLKLAVKFKRYSVFLILRFFIRILYLVCKQLGNIAYRNLEKFGLDWL